MLEVDFRTTSVRSKCPESLMVLDVTGSMVEWVRGVGDDAAGVTRMVWGMAFFNNSEERLHTANRCFVYQIDLRVLASLAASKATSLTKIFSAFGMARDNTN